MNPVHPQAFQATPAATSADGKKADIYMDGSHPEGGAGHPEASALFTHLWQTLSNLVGTPATATLLRRSLKRAALLRSRLSEVIISRAEHDYVFTLPAAWEQQPGEALADLRAMFAELCALSQQLTGSVIVRRLEASPVLAPLQRPSHEDKT